MKCPKIPTKPYAPYKPFKPEKQIKPNKAIHSFDLSSYEKFSINNFIGKLCNISKSNTILDQDKISFTIEVESEPTYYDETINTIKVSVYSEELMDDPDYDNRLGFYEKQLQKYNEKYKLYKEKLKKYKIEKEKFDIEYDKYLLECNKESIKKLENKLKKLKENETTKETSRAKKAV